jgi:cyclopropane-fatty-acyl-phospholipid synthase
MLLTCVGVNYSRTLEDWLIKFDRNRAPIRRLFETTYGAGNATMWIARWRMFFMACSELFAYDGGNQWFVSMYLFQPRTK